MAKTLYIISDLHLGAGDYLDDFDQDDAFAGFLESIASHRNTELIINGDFIDFVAVASESEKVRPFSRLGCSEDESLGKLEKVLWAHPAVFDSLREFLLNGNRLVLIPGNHDVDLFWPGVQERLREQLGRPDEERFFFEASGIYRRNGLHVEHGNQFFSDCAFEHFAHPFLKDPKTGRLCLERCWGTAFMQYFANGLVGERNPFIRRVKPISSMVFMGVQDESRWLTVYSALKVIRFLHRVGLPPYKDSQALLRRAREGRLDSQGYSRKRFLNLLSGPTRKDFQALEEAMEIGAGYPEEESMEELDRDELVLDSLATREDPLSVAARRLLLSDAGLDVVIFSHDHRYYSNELHPVVGGRKGRYYVNSGTWIPMLFLTRTRRKLRWRDLRDPRLYEQMLTYCLIRKGFVGTTASIKRLPRAVGTQGSCLRSSVPCQR